MKVGVVPEGNCVGNHAALPLTMASIILHGGCQVADMTKGGLDNEILAGLLWYFRSILSHR